MAHLMLWYGAGSTSPPLPHMECVALWTHPHSVWLHLRMAFSSSAFPVSPHRTLLLQGNFNPSLKWVTFLLCKLPERKTAFKGRTHGWASVQPAAWLETEQPPPCRLWWGSPESRPVLLGQGESGSADHRVSPGGGAGREGTQGGDPCSAAGSQRAEAESREPV